MTQMTTDATIATIERLEQLAEAAFSEANEAEALCNYYRGQDHTQIPWDELTRLTKAQGVAESLLDDLSGTAVPALCRSLREAQKRIEHLGSIARQKRDAGFNPQYFTADEVIASQAHTLNAIDREAANALAAIAAELEATDAEG